MPDKAQNVERIIIGNVRQSFQLDKGLQKGTAIQKLAAQFVEQIMFNPDNASRASAIAQLQSKTVQYFEGVVVPTAQAAGRQQAAALIQSIGGDRAAADVVNDPLTRRRILYDGQLKAGERVQIFQKLVSDAGNTLENRLGAFWLEPGRSAGQKLDTLRRIHETGEAARVKYEAGLQRFRGGEGTRPAKPNLDYLSRFTAYTTDETRAQARRVGTDAEHNVFESRGVKVFTWVTVNAGDACPDCRRRQGTTGTMAYFDTIGKPGAGATVCGSRCFCILVPKQTIYHAPGLARGVTVSDGPDGGGGPQPVITPPDVQAKIDAAKIAPPPAPVPVAKGPAERLREALDADVEAGKVHTAVLRAGSVHEAGLSHAEKRSAQLTADYKAIPLSDPDRMAKQTAIAKDLFQAHIDIGARRAEMRRVVHKKIQVDSAEMFDQINLDPVANQYNPAPTTFRSEKTQANVGSGGAFIRSVWRQPAEFKGAFPGSAKADQLGVNVVENGLGFRAHMAGQNKGTEGGRNTMQVAEDESVATVVHELGHELESRHPQGYKLAKTFLESRTKGQQVRKLKDVLPGQAYEDHEKGRDGEFGKAFGSSAAWYVGKEYDFEATEIISMGMERLYTAPFSFARNDPEYFRFIIGFLRGTLSI